jgi:hypothetical protein
MKKKNRESRRRQQFSDRENQENASPGNGDDPPTDMKPKRAELQAPITHHHPADKEQQAAERDYWRKQIRLSKWMNGITAAAAITAIFGLYLVYLSIVSANRAWLAPENFSFSDFSPNRNIKISMVSDNVGKEPALNPIFSNMDFGFVYPKNMKMLAAPGELQIPEKDMCATVQTSPGNVIFPGEKYSYERYITGLDPAKVTDVDEGRAVFYYRDCVKYKTFGREHKTSFCFYVYPNLMNQSLETVHCPIGNEAD